MPFIDRASVPPLELAPGVRLWPFHGPSLMLSYVELDAGAVVPLHHHPHEQGGMVVQGRLRFTIGGETKECGPGDMYLIPPDVPHTVEVVEAPAVALDVFTPIREDYAARVNQFVK
jgi:quercetin dioxygenase-like cupin family protein